MEKILISACLLGDKVRYDGKGKQLKHGLLQKWQEEDRLVAVCPEVSGGLSVPRAAAEIVSCDGGGEAVLKGEAKVVTCAGLDVTAQFLSGAARALEFCKNHGICVALLTDKSPSCGSLTIHDGRFSGGMVEGAGVTTALLQANGVKVFCADQIDLLADYLFMMES